MERRVDCVRIEKGSIYDDCRSVKKIGYELRDGVYERSPEFIGRRIEDGEEFYIETENEKLYLEAVAIEDEDDDEDDDEDEEEELYVRVLEEDSPDDPLLHIDRCE